MPRHNPRPVPPGAEWTKTGVKCAVPKCTARAIMHGLCETHARNADRPADKVGEPSGFGRFGIVDRDADTVLCHDCGRTFKRLEKHILRWHGDVADYRRRHGLRESDALLCQNLIERLRETSLARVGSDDWRKLEAAREANRAELERIAAEKNRQRETAPAAALNRTGRPVAVTRRACAICGTEFRVRDSRDKLTCSRACWEESKARAAGVREARRHDEPHDFQRRPAPSRTARKVRLRELADLLGLTYDAMRWRITSGQHPIWDGREHAVAFWWWDEPHV